MATLNDLREGLGRFGMQLTEGWRDLRERASQALTRFSPRRRGGQVESPAEMVEARSPEWGLIAAEVEERAKDVVVRLEIPGMDKDDLDVSVVGDTLVVSGEKRFERESTEGQFHVLECAYGAFERAVPLPVPVDDSKAKARYRNGVLEIALPKDKSAQQRQIPVGRR